MRTTLQPPPITASKVTFADLAIASQICRVLDVAPETCAMHALVWLCVNLRRGFEGSDNS